MNKADLIITDFSGIIFDFACVFDKPVIYADTSFDTLPYDADWLSEPRWSFKILPEIGIQLTEEDIQNIDQIILKALSSRNLQEGREKIRKQCWENIGNSAINATNYLIEKQEKLNND